MIRKTNNFPTFWNTFTTFSRVLELKFQSEKADNLPVFEFHVSPLAGA